jgi:hypothetical protein
LCSGLCCLAGKGSGESCGRRRNQTAFVSPVNALTNQHKGSTSMPNSQRPRRKFWMNACPVLITYALLGVCGCRMVRRPGSDACAGCEEFPLSGQGRPSAAALARRAGPVLAALRAAGPPAPAHHKGPRTPRTRSPQATEPRCSQSCCCVASGPAFSAADPGHGRPAPVKAASRPCGITLAREP